MASERVRKILVARGAPFTEDELESMTDGDGWRWLYKNFPPKGKRNKYGSPSSSPEICFTGFSNDIRESLIQAAKLANLTVKDSVTKNLKYLCTGPNAGPKKIETANSQSYTRLITLDEFWTLAETRINSE